jgi:hypothetical protein
MGMDDEDLQLDPGEIDPENLKPPNDPFSEIATILAVGFFIYAVVRIIPAPYAHIIALVSVLIGAVLLYLEAS